MAGEDTAAMLAQFADFMKAKAEAESADNDPDNDRDVAFTAADGSSITLPWRQARQYDLGGFLESKFGLKPKAAAGQQGGGDGDGGTGTGKGGKAPAAGGGKGTGAQGGGAGATVANLFRTGKQGQAS